MSDKIKRTVFTFQGEEHELNTVEDEDGGHGVPTLDMTADRARELLVPLTEGWACPSEFWLARCREALEWGLELSKEMG